MAPRILTSLFGRNIPQIFQGDVLSPSPLDNEHVKDSTEAHRERAEDQSASTSDDVDALARFFKMSEEEQIAQFSRLGELLGQTAPPYPAKGKRDNV